MPSSAVLPQSSTMSKLGMSLGRVPFGSGRKSRCSRWPEICDMSAALDSCTMSYLG